MNSIFLESKVSNEVEAYILGFIYSDGTIVANGGTGSTRKYYKTLNITLQKKR